MAEETGQSVEDYQGKFIKTRPLPGLNFGAEGNNEAMFLDEINSMGYRTPEFDTIDWNEAIVCFGCSMVYGVGLKKEDTWTYKLEKATGRPVINMGLPAGSNQANMHNQIALREIAKPYAVVNSWSSTFRDVAWSEHIEYPHHLGSWSLDTKVVSEEVAEKTNGWWEITMNDVNIIRTQQLLYRTAQILWEDTKHIQFTWFHDTHKLFKCRFMRYLDVASDQSHPGPNTATQVSEYIKNKL